MPRTPENFTVIDPRQLDGNPYEVAILSLTQAAGLLGLYRRALDDAFVMARNSEMERQMSFGAEKPDSLAFTDGPQGRRIQRLQSEAKEAHRDLEILATAAGFDPKNPPKVGDS